MSDITAFIQALPKVELHLHIEGSLEPELMFQMAARNQISIPYASVDQLRDAYQFNNLQEFLNIYYQGMQVLQTEQDFYDLTWAYLQRMQRQNVKHVEIFWDPQGYLERSVPFATQINGIHRALSDGQVLLGISFRLIMSFLRHLSEQSAFETLAAAEGYLDKIYAVGLDSSELGHPPEKFARVFAACRTKGLKLTAHAGEEGPAEYVYQALDILRVDRIDHGNRALEDTALVARLVEEQRLLTVCPLSNLKLQVVKDLAAHPISAMLTAGLMVTVNSDDPAYFGGYISENFQVLAEAQGLNRVQLATLACNAIKGSWATAERRAELLAELDQLCRAQSIKRLCLR